LCRKTVSPARPAQRGRAGRRRLVSGGAHGYLPRIDEE
jgi:hypothetical protein